MREPSEEGSSEQTEIAQPEDSRIIKKAIKKAVQSFAIQGVYLYKCPFCRAWMDFPLEKCLSCGKPNSYYEEEKDE